MEDRILRERDVAAATGLGRSTRYEMEGLLRDAELKLDQVYGDYDLAPYDDASEYMITIAKQPEERP